MTRKPKLTRVEKLLEAARKRPSPTCPDRRQLDLIEYVSTRENSRPLPAWMRRYLRYWRASMPKPLQQELGIGADIDPEVAQALIDLIEMGLVVDSGLRRNGRIVWCAVPEMKN
jgi:hypothetical protein